jgi:flagellar biosynthesis GTPase FlhF
VTSPRIFTATERLAESRGVKLALFGPTGVGKTTQLRNSLNSSQGA